MASQQPPFPTKQPIDFAVQRQNTVQPQPPERRFEAFYALCHENIALRGHGEFLAHQLWRQGHTYQQLALHCNDLYREHKASIDAFTNLQARLDTIQSAMDTERQRHTVTRDAYRFECNRRKESDRSLTFQCGKARRLELIIAEMGLMKPEELDEILKNNIDIGMITKDDWMAAHGVIKEERDLRQVAFTLECYKQLVGNLKERHEYMSGHLDDKDVEIQRLRKELHDAHSRTAMLSRQKA